MKQEIQVAGRSFVLDDPHGTIARPAAPEIRSEHVHTMPLGESIRVIRAEREKLSMQLPNNVDPIGSIRGRALLLERFLQGQFGTASLVFAWLAFGGPMLLVIAMTLDLCLDIPARHPGAGGIFWACFGALFGCAPPAAGLIVLILGTRASLKRRSLP